MSRESMVSFRLASLKYMYVQTEIIYKYVQTEIIYKYVQTEIIYKYVQTEIIYNSVSPSIITTGRSARFEFCSYIIITINIWAWP